MSDQGNAELDHIVDALGQTQATRINTWSFMAAASAASAVAAGASQTAGYLLAGAALMFIMARRESEIFRDMVAMTARAIVLYRRSGIEDPDLWLAARPGFRYALALELADLADSTERADEMRSVRDISKEAILAYLLGGLVVALVIILVASDAMSLF